MTPTATCTSDIQVYREGEDRIVLQLPGVDDPNKVTDLITATATIEFRMVDQSGLAKT